MAKKKKAEESTAPQAPKANIERYEMAKMTRSDLKKAEYNPRNITEQARKRLAKGMEKLGLLQPIIWNKRSGNIVGGHQRLSVMDDYYGSDKYELQVAVVDLDDKQEKEANILLNNFEAQGDFDIDKLNNMLGEGLDIEATGFDAASVFRLFGDSAQVSGSVAETFADQVRKSMEDTQSIFNNAKNANPTDFYVVFVFANVDQRDKFLTKHGFDDNRFQSGARLQELLDATEGSAVADTPE
jgi:hypothetical protein